MLKTPVLSHENAGVFLIAHVGHLGGKAIGGCPFSAAVELQQHAKRVNGNRVVVTQLKSLDKVLGPTCEVSFGGRSHTIDIPIHTEYLHVERHPESLGWH